MILSRIPLSWLRSEQGQDLSDYALILGLVVIICLGAIGMMGSSIVDTFSTVTSALRSL